MKVEGAVWGVIAGRFYAILSSPINHCVFGCAADCDDLVATVSVQVADREILHRDLPGMDQGSVPRSVRSSIVQSHAATMRCRFVSNADDQFVGLVVIQIRTCDRMPPLELVIDHLPGP